MSIGKQSSIASPRYPRQSLVRGRWVVVRIAITVSTILLALHPTLAFTVANVPMLGRDKILPLISTSSVSSSSGPAAVHLSSEIQEFESWFTSAKGSQMDSRIQHGTVGNLRGLIWKRGSLETSTRVATIPSSLVLSTDYSKDDWDAKLAIQLWKAVQEGDSSKHSGYCKLLLRVSSREAPISTAPHALRRWSDDQRQLLAETSKGQKILQLEKDQTNSWKQKYNAISASSKVSWEQFQWAMEAVHSRAFCGVQTSSILSSIAAPIVAAAAVLFAYNTLPPSDIPVVAVIATAGSVIPTFLQQKKSAVLIPLVDSANHLEAADSSIDFDPIKGSFELSIGPKCLVEENDGSTQLYISYGTKSKEELLLNYGFLPDVPVDISDDEYRRSLAANYQK